MIVRSKSCAAGLIGSAMGFIIVHGLAYTNAMNDKSLHMNSRDAFWAAVFYDMLVGIPIAALCGWAFAYTFRDRSAGKAEPETDEAEEESG